MSLADAGIKEEDEGMRHHTVIKERNNGRIHLLFVRQEYKECLEVIEDCLLETNGLCEYALYIKALIRRMEGRIQDSLTLFQAATFLNPRNTANLKQVGRCLYLLGKHRHAIDVYDEAAKLDAEDWEIHHNKGLCYMYLKQYDMAVDCFESANSISRHDATYMQLGKVFQLKEDFRTALQVYTEALEFSPENPELLTTMGLIYMRLGDNQRAFEFLGNSLTHDPKNPKTILAAGSIIQDHQDMDVALIKYRVAAVYTPNSAQLWNNVGMCFFGKARFVAAVACLKRALYLDPFEWIICYNLGLVHLRTGQFASAFHYLSAAINMKSDFAASYMYLAIALNRLEDFDNCCSAYDKAIELESHYLTHLNYAITLYNNDEPERAVQQYRIFEKGYAGVVAADGAADVDVNVLSMSKALASALNMS